MKNSFERFVHYLIYIIVLLSPVVARATEPPSEAQPSVFVEGVVIDSEGPYLKINLPGTAGNRRDHSR